MELRIGEASFDSKLNALGQLTLAAVKNNGKVTEHLMDIFFETGYTEANLIDSVIIIGEKIISKNIYNLPQFAIHFPLSPELELEVVQ